MLPCPFTIACSDENHETAESPSGNPELDHEPSIKELVEGINRHGTNTPLNSRATSKRKIWYKAAAGDDLYGYEGDVYVHRINDWMCCSYGMG